MADNTTVVRSGRVGLPTLLFVVFLVLRLTGNIDWPWYAVAAPLLIPLGIWMFFALWMLAIGLIAAARS